VKIDENEMLAYLLTGLLSTIFCPLLRLNTLLVQLVLDVASLISSVSADIVIRPYNIGGALSERAL